MQYIYMVLPISGVLYLILGFHEMLKHVMHGRSQGVVESNIVQGR
jgi:Na+/H+ antiporter NhaC